jgi:hypothetical protein
MLLFVYHRSTAMMLARKAYNEESFPAVPCVTGKSKQTTAIRLPIHYSQIMHPPVLARVVRASTCYAECICSASGCVTTMNAGHAFATKQPGSEFYVVYRMLRTIVSYESAGAPVVVKSRLVRTTQWNVPDALPRYTVPELRLRKASC